MKLHSPITNQKRIFKKVECVNFVLLLCVLSLSLSLANQKGSSFLISASLLL